jgi:hypothetical protein
MADQPDLRHAVGPRRAHCGRRAVRAAVVHEDGLEAVAALQRRVDFPGERQDVLLLIADGNDDRDFEVRGRCIAEWRSQDEGPAVGTLV